MYFYSERAREIFVSFIDIGVLEKYHAWMRAIQDVYGSSVKTKGKLVDFYQMSVAVDFDLHVPSHGHRTAEIFCLGL